MASARKTRKSPHPQREMPSAPKSFSVLVADDHDIIHYGLKRMLSDQFGAITVGEARNAQETLDQCARQSWDMVLLDISMPDRSGLEILAELKRVCPTASILIMSAFPEEEFAMRAFQSGAVGYLDKRKLAAEVVEAIQRVLAGERYVSGALASKLAGQIGGSLRPAHEALSQREFQVLRLVAGGKTIKEIAAELSLSEKTIGTYRTRISEKLGLGTNVEITRYAMQHRLVE
jgi:DNA-binding NarL/FixJ family response regulator